ncbi:hypothetical protein J437_LFUL006607 [Ladona fulva]|uniref:Insulin receptor substrate 1 n=1 Tax=Ladona fulva TaxID=123851 RepID=A0A8K0KH38_LADFU|nr:hypothetical protein J437_LFUL006607 [Ladona fulva]
METETSIKEGYLLFPPHGVLGQLKKTWHKKYCQLFKSSNHGIERLEVFDREEEARKSSSVRIITLENCVKISPDSQNPQPFVFMVVTKTLTYYFAATTQKEMQDWIIALQSVAFRFDRTKQTVEEDNELYCISGEGVFSVKVIPTEASRRCGLNSGNYTLRALKSEIELVGSSGSVLTWPYRYIRRYGHSEGIFTFEAGRKCPSGAGSFQFEHVYGVDVFRCISSRMKNMRKLLNAGSSGDLTSLHSPPPSQEMDRINNVPLNFFWTASRSDESGHSTSPSTAPTVCMDEILQAAVNNMEPGSRSPLSAMPPFGSGLNSESGNSTLEDLSMLPMKPIKSGFKPAKPPRKALITSPMELTVQQRVSDSAKSSGRLDYSIITTETDTGNTHPYDKVEIRKEAWRTMGVDDLQHCENSTNFHEVDLNPSKERKKLPDPPDVEHTVSFKSSKIIVANHLQSPDEENYDKLQHLGTQNSKRGNNDTRYKHITPLTFSNSGSQSPNLLSPNEQESHESSDWNDYDVVEDCMQAVRLADDSHLGYGMIRKKTLDGEDGSNLSKPCHTYYNDLEYAVIEKPKKSSPKP